MNGRNIYEVYDRKTGRMLANGDVASCARKLQISQAGFRLAANNDRHRKYMIRHVATMKRIFSVYDEKAGLISRGTVKQVAEEMQCSQSAVEYWGRIGQAKGMTVEVTEELEPTEAGKQIEHPCTGCGKDCPGWKSCELWKAWWINGYDGAREIIRRMVEE